MTLKILLLALVLSVSVLASEDYYKPLPYKMTYSEEMKWRDSHPGGWDRNYPTRADFPGLWLPNARMFDLDKEFGAMTAYLLIAWLIWPFVTLLLLACGNKTAKMIGLAMLIPWLWFSMNRYMEFFCIWCVLPVWLIGATIRNIKKTVVG